MATITLVRRTSGIEVTAAGEVENSKFAGEENASILALVCTFLDAVKMADEQGIIGYAPNMFKKRSDGDAEKHAHAVAKGKR